MREILISFIAGAIMAGLAVFYFVGHSATESLRLLKLGEVATAESRALQAYQHEDSAVAIWEMRHLIDLLEESLDAGIDNPRQTKLQLLLANGRLASLYSRENETNKSLNSVTNALKYQHQLYPTNKLHGFDDLSVLIERTDKKSDDRPS